MKRLRDALIEIGLGLLLIFIGGYVVLSREGFLAGLGTLGGWWVIQAIPFPAKILLSLDLATAGWAVGWAARSLISRAFEAGLMVGEADRRMPSVLRDTTSLLVVVQLVCVVILQPDFRGRLLWSTLLPGNQLAGVWSGIYVEGDVWLAALACSTLSLAACVLGERVVTLGNLLFAQGGKR